MFLVDLNQVLIANLMEQIGSDPKKKLDENLIRHMFLNSLRAYSKQYKNKYGTMVIACDSRKYWRREVFPFYKANRKKDREASPFDWSLIFDTLGKFRDELKENFPYKVIEVERAEADDIIGVLGPRFAAHENVLILSSDKDFMQLQKYKNITQYSPNLKRFIKPDDPGLFLKEHIIRGDKGDGIPNFLSPDNLFLTDDRQKSINKKKLAQWLLESPEEFCVNDTMLRGYKRNQMLVDLDYIPEDIQQKIVEEFENAKPPGRQKLLDYFMTHRLRVLTESIDEF